ncbi:guanylate cyclase [Plakobranchus ocellatus]|uniref:Guanylate cyclase n=1 Tax=Plakobranchus ocellatus TaxID=259542 RepID=A0AAV3Y6T4_9GAST|nr:guanylate cyclase [Plakobranchus ocellatus]
MAALKMRLGLHLLIFILTVQVTSTGKSIYENGCPVLSANAITTTEATPTVLPGNMKAQSLHLAFVTSLKGEGKYYGGAFFLAVDKLNANARKEGIPANFSFSFHETDNSEAHSIRVMTDIYCKKNISVFIGPDVFCKPAALSATAFNIPYMTFEFRAVLRQTMVDTVLVHSKSQNCNEDIYAFLLSLDQVPSLGANTVVDSQLGRDVPIFLRPLISVPPESINMKLEEEKVMIYIAGYIAKIQPAKKAKES